MLTIVMSIAIATSPCQCKAILPWRDHVKSWMMHQKTYMMKSNAKHFGSRKLSRREKEGLHNVYIAMVNSRLNFRRFIEVKAYSMPDARNIARAHLEPQGYDKIESCIYIA